MKKIVLAFIHLILSTIVFAQSKKEQIQMLTFRVDSINSILSSERNTIAQKEQGYTSKISNLENQITLLKSEIELINKKFANKEIENDNLKNELTKRKNENDLLVNQIKVKSDSLVKYRQQTINKDNSLNQENSFSTTDLISFSKYKWAFLEKDSTLNEYYGDIECVDQSKSLFDFYINCGRSGDIISIIISKNPLKNNCFELFIPKGKLYYGKFIDSTTKIGEIIICSENKIKGYIKLCLEKSASCCGTGENENFVLIKTSNDLEK